MIEIALRIEPLWSWLRTLSRASLRGADAKQIYTPAHQSIAAAGHHRSQSGCGQAWGSCHRDDCAQDPGNWMVGPSPWIDASLQPQDNR